MNENGNNALLCSTVGQASETVAKAITDDMVNSIRNLIKKIYGGLRIELGNAFQLYLQNAYLRYNNIRTLATGINPRPIIGAGNIYVAANVSANSKTISANTAESLRSISNNLIILGTAGLGKSMLMRYLFLNTVNRGEYIPIFLELRKLNKLDPSNINILDLICSCIEDFNVKLPTEQFEYSLKRGKYLFLLDGFDEIKETISKDIAEAIQSFCAKYPLNQCIVSSRSMENLFPLETFKAVNLMPFDKEQALQMISKIGEDDRADEFYCQLEGSLFADFREFTQNPLLLCMMYISFICNGSVPRRLSEFYEKAFVALYSLHDSHNKRSFKREYKCSALNEEQFRQVFSHFCFHSYFDGKVDFSEAEILSYIDSSLNKLSLSDVQSHDYLFDLQNSICLIDKEGVAFHFSHSSFQTFFAAYYASYSLSDDNQKNFFRELLSIERVDAVCVHSDFFDLVNEMEPQRFIINLAKDCLRHAQNQVDRLPEPSIAWLKQTTNGLLDLDAALIANLDLSNYHYGRLYNNSYLSAVLILFKKYLPYNHYNIPSEQDAKLALAAIRKTNCYEHHFGEGQSYLFEDIDSCAVISEKEKMIIYSYAINLFDINGERNAIKKWLIQVEKECRKASLRTQYEGY